RIASAILANVGGDTSHAAITSRELGIPAVIGIQRLEALRALDGLEVTVDGTHGKVYKGALPLRDYGSIIDIASVPDTKTRVGLILADVGQSLFLSRLRKVSDFEVGLLRAEFMLGNIGVHPSALEAFDNGSLQERVTEKLNTLEQKLTKLVKNQIADGQVSLNFNLRHYVAILTGLDKELEKANSLDARGSEALHQQQSLIRAIEHKIDEHTEIAFSNIDILQSSPYIEEHIQALYLDGVTPFDIITRVEEVENNPVVIEHINKIRSLRDKIAITSDIQKEKEELLSIEEKIRQIITAQGAKSGKEHYVQTLSQGLALFALAFHNKSILYRTTDFKSNEYHNLLGGMLFEKTEDNPMLGYRGISRGVHTWEVEAFKKARLEYGGMNLQIMLPFVRTIEEARSVKEYLRSVHNLESGKDELKIFLMSEIPSNAILAKQFISEFDGLSIGSNDMTQMVLGTDRDNSDLQDIYDEEDPAVIWSILVTIFTGQKYCKKIGFCGQGVSNSPILRGIVTMAGITVASVVPDTYLQTKQDIATIEQQGLTIYDLSTWLRQQYLSRIHSIAKEYGYQEVAEETSIENIERWYKQQIEEYHSAMRKYIHSPEYKIYEEKANLLRKRLYKAIIYAQWNWEETIQDALHTAGFASFEEQQQACLHQRDTLYK
ncbi:MAG: phosphoenolpyruvate synthase, partial [Desulfovibrionaceae bacterium]|nr:phosphoenolpyruvate synthase [Desulfovibrionaceae bacterium]